MSKRHSRLIEYFITVGIEFESVAPINDDSITNPIRELRIVSEKEQIPDGFERITTTITGKDASLTKKGMMMKNTRHYLCYSREGGQTLFTRIQYIKAKNISQEWNRVPGKIMSGKTEYCLCTKNDGSVPPIADICIITVDGKESCPEGYVKLPHTINSLAICFRHLPMDALGLRYQTCILDRYPSKDYADSPLSNTVAVFCQPNGADIRNEASMPTFLSFVLTDSEGRKMYAITVTFYDKLEEEDEECCKRSLSSIYTEGFKPVWPDKDKNKQLYHSKSVCILSYYPFFLSFREVLKEIYRLANSPGRIPIERYIINLCEETPLPIPSRRCIELLYAHKPIIFRIPNDDELPLLDSNIKKIFCCLSLKNTLLIFQVLLTQKYKMLFTSSHISLITEICEGITSFLQPFEWQFTYVPVLPYSVFGILEAPVPVLVGMHSSRIKPDYYSDHKEIIIVDLDNNSVHIPSNIELIDIPQNVFKSLKSDLKTYAKANKVALFDKNTIQFVDSAFNVQISHDDDDDDFLANINKFNPTATRAAFYKFWIKLLGPSYQQFLQFPDNDDMLDINDIFDTEAFIKSRPKNIKKFWNLFSETQAFQKFIEDLTFESTEDRAVALRAFYKCSQYEHKEGDYSENSMSSNSFSPKLSKALSTTNLSTSSFSIGDAALNSNHHNKHPQIDPFTEFLEERIPQLLHYQVPQANEDKLDKTYKFEVKSAFPILNDKYLIEPRICNLLSLIENEEKKDDNNDNNKKNNNNVKTVALKAPKSPKIKINSKDPNDIPKNGRMSSRDRMNDRSKQMGRGRSINKYQTPMDRAKFQLLQIYGTWFAAHVAALDFKDIPGDEVEEVVRNTLDILYRMTDIHTSRDVKLIPDELIYKACLILCGKFGKKKEASKLFKDLKKNGITPSQKTYGAYTNAMASSGANMLLSAAGSTSSGASSLAGRTHRRSFAPTVDGLNAIKTRSLSAAINSNSRLNAPHKINTIREDDEHDNINNINRPHSPFDDDDEQKSPLKLLKHPSSPYVKLRAIKEQEKRPNFFKEHQKHGANKSIEITLSSNGSMEHYNDENNNGNNNGNNKNIEINGINGIHGIHGIHGINTAIGPLIELNNTKSQPNMQHLASLNNSVSTPTPSPKIEEEPPPLAVPSSDEETGNIQNGGGNNNNNLEITPEVWKDETTEPTTTDEEEEEAKESKPISSLNTTQSTSPYSTPSVLSSDLPNDDNNDNILERGHRVSQPLISTNCNNNNNKTGKPEKIAIIIDYSTLEIEAKHECKCGYILSDAQIMVGWCSEFTANLRCIMCRQNAFEPKLHLRYNITKMSMQDGICSFESMDKFIEYISPLQLRSKINLILQHRRLDFEDPETFRSKHCDVFWNMLWYFDNRQLDLSFLLGEHDAAALDIKPFRNIINNNNINDNDNKLEPKSDDELLSKLKPIYDKASNNKIREGISEWLLNRSQTPSEERNLWIWNLSVFDSFHDLDIPSKYKSYDLFIKEYKNACRNIRPKIRDRAWDEPSLAIQHCFKHPRISNLRLTNLTPKLSGKPLRPHIPLPIPPKKR